MEDPLSRSFSIVSWRLWFNEAFPSPLSFFSWETESDHGEQGQLILQVEISPSNFYFTFLHFHTKGIRRRSPTTNYYSQGHSSNSKCSFFQGNLMFSFPISSPVPLTQWRPRFVVFHPNSSSVIIFDLPFSSDLCCLHSALSTPFPGYPPVVPRLSVTGKCYPTGITDSNSPPSGHSMLFF